MQCLSHEQLVAVLFGSITVDDEVAIDTHLTDCPACQYELERHAADSALLTDLKLVEPVSAAVEHLVAAHRRNDSPSQFDATAGTSSLSVVTPQSTVETPQPPAIPGIEFEEIVGRGGMGVVWRARDVSLDRTVAIKLMAPHLLHCDAARQRFLQEARAVARITNDHVVTVHAVGEVAGTPYLVMAFIEGESLEQRLRRDRTLSTEQAIRLAEHVGRALEAAHEAGVIHRDIKPANVLLEAKTDRALLVDFGLACAADDANLTRTGVVAGTPEYMSPEQIHGSDVDHRTDLFSLASLLYRSLAGVPPFHGSNAIAIAHQIVQAEVPRLKHVRKDVPMWISDVIEKLHAKDPDARFRSATELLHALAGRSTSNTSRRQDQRRTHRFTIVAAACMLLFAVTIVSMAIVLHQPSADKPVNAATPACLLRHADGTTETLNDLASAISTAEDGATIELTDAHEWHLDTPSNLANRRLAIHASPGTRPVITTSFAARQSHLLQTSRDLELRGLTFRFHIGHNAPPGSALVVVANGRLQVEGCRFQSLNEATRHACIGVQGRSECNVVDTLFSAGQTAAALNLQAGDGAQLSLSNCCIAAGRGVSIASPHRSHANAIARLQLHETTCDTGSVVNLFVGRMRRQRDASVEIDAVGNTFHSQHILAISSLNHGAADGGPSFALNQLRRTISWSGDDNVFSFRTDREGNAEVSVAYCGFVLQRERTIPILSGPRSLISWQDFCTREGEGSKQHAITFTSPLRMRTPTSQTFNADAFRWE